MDTVQLEEAVYLAGLDDPEWSEAGKVHDWRNHVPEEVRELWETLDFAGRYCVALMAIKHADNENWD